MDNTELNTLISYLEVGIPASFQMFVSAFAIIIIILAASFVGIFFLKLIRTILNIGASHYEKLER